MTRRGTLRLVLWVAVIATTLGAIAAYVIARNGEPPGLASGAMLDADFSLVTEDGIVVTQANFRDKPTAWFFGFTHCPDVCPTQLASMTANLADLGADADRLNVVLVSVDPERDTADVLRQYLTAFDERIVGLTGELAEVEKLAAGYFVFFDKVPQENGGYTMNHTAGILITSARGELLSIVDPHEPRETQVAKLRLAIEG